MNIAVGSNGYWLPMAIVIGVASKLLKQEESRSPTPPNPSIWIQTTMANSTCMPKDRDDSKPDREEPEARWANRFKTGCRPHVIELVFYQIVGNNEKQRILTRIITSPDDAKDFLRNLKETIDKYEEMYGPIHSDE